MTPSDKVRFDGRASFWGEEMSVAAQTEKSWKDSESARLHRLSVKYRMSAEDVRALEMLLAKRFSVGRITLDPIGKCVWPVFRAKVDGLTWAFVKVAPLENNQRTIDFTRAVSGCDLVPKVLHDAPITFGFRSVLCAEWRDCVRIPAEEMTEVEATSLLDGIVRLSSAMRNTPNVLDPDGRDAPSRQFAIVSDWAKRHPVASRLFRKLLEVPADMRDYGSRPLATIHGDMHMKNYGFMDGRFSTVFDFDTLVKGLPCEDVCYAFTERMRKSELSAAAKRRLLDLFRRIAAESPWSADEWRIAVNHARLRIASRRLQKHPRNSLVALDVERRDRELRPLLEVIA